MKMLLQEQRAATAPAAVPALLLYLAKGPSNSVAAAVMVNTQFFIPDYRLPTTYHAPDLTVIYW